MITSLSLIEYISEFLVVFSVGSGAGWWIEFIYRGFVRKGNLVNPGFLSGPYLPIYGFGAFFLYVLGTQPLTLVLQILIFTLAATVMELLTGLFFVRFFNIRLWDYSERWGNVKGQICPLFTLYWMIAGFAGLIWVVPLLVRAVAFMNSHIHYTFFLGIYYGIIISDVVNSFHVASRLSAMIQTLQEVGRHPILDYRKFRLHLREAQGRLRQKNYLGRFLLPFNNLSRKDLEEHLLRFSDRIKDRNPIKNLRRKN